MKTDKNHNNNASQFYYEFGGPIGTGVNIVLLPVLVQVLAHWSAVGTVEFTSWTTDIANATTTTTTTTYSASTFWQAIVDSPVLCPSCRDASILIACTAIVLGWFLWFVVLERCLPGEVVQGAPIHGDTNHRLSYKLNGHLSFWITVTALYVGWPYWHEASESIQFTTAPLGFLYDHFGTLAMISSMACFFLSTYLYVTSFLPGTILSKVGTSGYFWYDFWMGRELNPRSLGGSFDWKVFCELRPGLVGWMVLNLSCLQQQHQRLGYVSGSMLLINLFQGIYVWDAQFQERAILTTMDITTDGFGFMLVFGDLTWVPFTYSLQARYLVEHDPHLSYLNLLAIILLYSFGFMIFRGANSQKDAFRRAPEQFKDMRYLQTKRGTKLLLSGWWGLARKINFTGDWIMGLCWCLLCGVQSPVPYYYAIYFAILLMHRAERDDHQCKLKYGDDWDIYKRLVPYKFIPGII